MSWGPGLRRGPRTWTSQEDAAAGGALLAAEEAVLRGGQGLDQSPEMLERDALAITDAHLAQDFTKALVCSQALTTQGHQKDMFCQEPPKTEDNHLTQSFFFDVLVTGSSLFDVLVTSS